MKVLEKRLGEATDTDEPFFGGWLQPSWDASSQVCGSASFREKFAIALT
jgi:hypothetical protein